MNRLQQLVERDQWAELLASSSNANKQSVNSHIEVLAFSDKSALAKASEVFNAPKNHLNLEKTKEGHSSLFGFIKTPSSYISSIKEEFKPSYANNTVDYDEYNNLAQNKNGSFKLVMKIDGLFLQVFPPKGVGSVVTLEELEDEIEIRNYTNIDTDLLIQALDTFQPVILAPYKKTDDNSVVTVNLSRDSMEATFKFSKPREHGRIPELSEVMKELRQAGVKLGIKEEYILEALDNELYSMPIMAAEGTPAKNGDNAYIEYKFSTGDEGEEHSKYNTREDGSVDFKELNTIQNVFENDVLAIMHPATKGQVGHTILGERLDATDGTPMEWNIGPNVILSADKTQALASQAGQVYIKSKQICVDPALELPGDVDLSTGNIDFVGNIIIKGGISDGFSVLSGGNVEVFGHIGRCYLYAEGNIIAHQGIQGKDEAQIECKGDLFANFIERSLVNVGGNLVVTKSLLHSKAISGKSIYVIDEKKSIIAGGDIKAQNEIVSAQIGAESYIETNIEIGYSKPLIQKNATLQKNISSISEQMTEYKNQLSSLVPTSDEAMQLTKMLNSSSKQMAKNEQILEQNRGVLQKLRKSASISATKAFLPGVKLKLGANTLDITSEQSAGTIKADSELQLSMGSLIPSKGMEEYATPQKK